VSYLDDLELDCLVGLGAAEASADGLNDPVNKLLAGHRRVRDVAREVPMGDEFLHKSKVTLTKPFLILGFRFSFDARCNP